MLIWRIFFLKESKVWIRKRSSLKSLGEPDGRAVRGGWPGSGGPALAHASHPLDAPRPPLSARCLPPAGDSSSSATKRNWLLVRHYWHRVGGAALNWFVWDFAFYVSGSTTLFWSVGFAL